MVASVTGARVNAAYVDARWEGFSRTTALDRHAWRAKACGRLQALALRQSDGAETGPGHARRARLIR